MNTHVAQIVPELPKGWTPAHDLRWGAIFAMLMRREGAFVDNPADRGGATAYGLSLRFLKALGFVDTNHDGLNDLDLNFDTVIDGRDVRLLTPELARPVYLKHFFVGPGFWNLPRPFDAAVCDQGVNAGVTAAIKLLQRALNAQGQPYLKVDGDLGPATRASLADRLKYDFPVLASYREAAADRYRAICAADPTQTRFLRGWLARAQELGRV